jgi:ferritin-like metal-binding protein YciE
MPELEDKLVTYIQEVHALEQAVGRMLDSVISTTNDVEIREIVEQHKDETVLHERRLRERLEAHGAEPSRVRDYAGIGGAAVKGLTDQVRHDKPAKNARDAFAAEQLEIASYEILERIARRVGDTETARVAKDNRRDEEAMAKKISKHWDRFIDLTLAEEREREAVPA